ncbi:MAG: protein-glutamate O-methyltransferase CheR [Anaerolineales bacterium]|nr:MAG: protein-glutamate O-methyltransferase CheR [Anaerolineales bacterium]
MTERDGTARPDLTTSEYDAWREFVWQQSGLYFPENRREFLARRIWERMRARRIHSYSEYYHFVRFNPQGGKEWEELLELLVIGETGFFRHEPSFRALAEILPHLLLRNQERGNNTLRMWSAGCSTGQEAYSLAMLFLETVRFPELWQVEIMATDISRRAVEKARKGLYKPFEIRYMPEHFRDKYLTVEEEAGATASTLSSRSTTRYRVAKRVRAMVHFGYLNLSDPTSCWVTAQDVIFCQNVLIYFKSESRVETARHLCQRLYPGGYLFLAPAEVIGLKLPGVQLVHFEDSLVYKRVK